MTISFILNGEDVSAKVRTVDRLSDLLREGFGLLGLRSDCRSGRCGRCLIFLDGKLVPSCIMPAFNARGKEVVTIEGYAMTEDYRDIVEGFKGAGLVCCGFCDEAKIMAAGALLETNPRPSPREILDFMSVVPCRCTDPDSIVKGVEAVVERRARRMYRRAHQ
jgi:Aerobic-type carbon monoxide dehydrogenase, small subunit CoxS/CutS homologs